MRALLLAIVVSLAITASAAADAVSVQPLRDAGYTVGVASDLGNGCTTWAVSGHGVSVYVNDCDADAPAAIASLTDPTLIFERDWQTNHPEQLQAASAIANACYSISRTAPATDQWRIVGGPTDVTVAGGQLAGLAGQLPNLRQPDGQCPTGTTAAVVPTGTGSSTTAPGAPEVAAAITTQAQALAAAAAAAAAPPGTPGDPVDPASYTIVKASASVTAATGIVAWVNTPYMGVALTAADLPPVVS